METKPLCVCNCPYYDNFLTAKEARTREGIQRWYSQKASKFYWEKMAFPDNLQQEMVLRLILFGQNGTEKLICLF